MFRMRSERKSLECDSSPVLKYSIKEKNIYNGLGWSPIMPMVIGGRWKCYKKKRALAVGATQTQQYGAQKEAQKAQNTHYRSLAPK